MQFSPKTSAPHNRWVAIPQVGSPPTGQGQSDDAWCAKQFRCWLAGQKVSLERFQPVVGICSVAQARSKVKGQREANKAQRAI